MRILSSRLAVWMLVVLAVVSTPVYSQVKKNKTQPRDKNVLPVDNVPTISEDMSDWLYLPFYQHNRLQSLHGAATIRIDRNYPRLDGATAVCPIFAAAMQGTYRGIDDKTVRQYFACSRTPNAYQRLINGETDLIFAAQPSTEQIAAAKAKGLKLQMTPVAKEAFVFLVNKQNPVSGLSVQQIRAIYSGQIDNWKGLGGRNAQILAFQRPVGSGSQTTMLKKVMQGTPLKAPLMQQEIIPTMGKVVRNIGTSVASYRNYQHAIGYSFRFYATEMVRNNNVRLLSVDGVEPTPANIRNGRYPFTVDVYMVTARPQSANTKKLVNWFLSKQGQRLVEDVGYVGVK